MNRQQLQEMQQLGIRAQELSMQFTALIEMFRAACFSGNGQEADTLRERMHVVLDGQLDAIAGQTTLTRRGLDTPM